MDDGSDLGDDKIVLDRRSFEALAVDTRIRILKSLKERRKTLTELAKEQKMSVSGIKEHLTTLERVELIDKIDDGHKWKYYELTKKGREIIGPKEVRVWILLSLSTFALVASIFIMFMSPHPILQSEFGTDMLPQSNMPAYETGSADMYEDDKEPLMIESEAGADTTEQAIIPEADIESETTNDASNEVLTIESESTTVETISMDTEEQQSELENAAPATVMRTQNTEEDFENNVTYTTNSRAQPDGLIPTLIASISTIVIIACLAILIRNRIKATPTK
ncbi:winged helix-turn-helix domain-containing protein [Candidatus Micrarchaeota archaeon]|nr:winged helix-turn-helix domain-containing protein [Candidatus Micrarchaeota archaeon]MBU1166092.1 winged helix-turn-helix domain-containing protein [Candidatus Micrarchaeota archaeon]MBU1886660.1 winged helix-turn-helix domain-containing protein [Candidatus Micrarchaeota archaeon]